MQHRLFIARIVHTIIASCRIARHSQEPTAIVVFHQHFAIVTMHPLTMESKTTMPQCVKIRLTHPESLTPVRATQYAAAFDVFARVNVPIKETTMVPLGFCLQMPEGMYAILHGRSGYAAKRAFVAHEGIIDQDYTGELQMIIQIPAHKVDDYPCITAGERIGQITFHHHVPVVFEEVSEIRDTERGTGGFGSTGTGHLPISRSAAIATMRSSSSSSSGSTSPLDEARQACLEIARSPLGKRESPDSSDDEEARDPPPSVACSPATTQSGGVWR